MPLVDGDRTDAAESEGWARKLANGHVVLRFDLEEALVLYECLRRWEDQGVMSGLPFDDEAEQQVLREMGAALAAVLPERLRPEYHDRVVEAQATMQDRLGAYQR